MSEIWSVANESPATAVLVAIQTLCFAGFGFALSKEDIASHRLPNRLVGAWALASALIVGALALVRGDIRGFLLGILGMILLGGAYLLISFAAAGAMGMGDVKLAGVLGLNLGYYSLPALFFASALAFLLASCWVLGGVLLRKMTLKSAVPFGPFMICGAIAALLVAR